MADEKTPTTTTESNQQAGQENSVRGETMSPAAMTIPAANAVEVVAVQAGAEVPIAFSLDDVEMTVVGGDLQLGFENGSTLVLQDFAALAATDNPPTLMMADGTMLPGDAVIFSYADTELAPAAGPALGSGGVGTYRSDMGETIAGVGRLGVQDPGALPGTTGTELEDDAAVLGGNAAPVAADDFYETDEDVSLVVDGTIDPTVLANDNDLDLDTLTVNTTPVVDVSHGSLTLNADGSFTYVPGDNFNGNDSFVYQISDGAGGTAQATANITVIPINDVPEAADDYYVTDEDVALVVDGTIDPTVLANDNDLDLDTLTVNTTPITDVTNGSLTLNADGTFTYVPGDNFNGNDSFVYQIDDGAGGTAQATAYIVVNPLNDAPTAVDDAYVTDEDVALVVDGTIDPTVLANDNDLDLDTLTVNTIPVADVANGTLDLNADGTFTYTPDADFNGNDSFVYEISDGAGGTAQATAYIDVIPDNDPPLAIDDGQAVNTAVLIGSTNTMPVGFYLVTLTDPEDPNVYSSLFDVDVKFDELSYDSSGTLWGAENSNRQLSTIDISTGELTPQFLLPEEIGNDIDGFTFGVIGGEEKLYVLGGSTLFVVDPGTVEIMDSYDLSGSSNDLADLVLLNGNLYTVSSNGAFFEINLDDYGNIELDGGLPDIDTLNGDAFSSVYGLVAGSDGLLYVVTSTGNSGEASALSIDSEADTYSVNSTWDLDAKGIGGNFLGLAGQVNPDTEVDGNVLDNDSDIDSDFLTVIDVDGTPLTDDPTDPSDPVDEITLTGDYGTLTISSDGEYTYSLTDEMTPGQDVFTYTISDGDATDSADLIFNVNNYTALTTLAGLEGMQAVMDTESMIYSFSANGGEGDLVVDDFNVDTDVLQLTDVMDLDSDGGLDPGDVALSIAVAGSDLMLTITGQDGVTNITLTDVGSYPGVDSLDDLVDQAGFQVEYTG
ncbi:MAG: tandem-95 repeat protein [Desulfuromonas sp.]|nr:tandem-95 repeat protein [Desulfuromonas sp.]